MLRLKNFSRGYAGLLDALRLTALYAAWIAVIRLFVLTLITYFLMASAPLFQDIAEAYASNELTVMGAAAALFLVLMASLNPLTSTTKNEIFQRAKFEKNFLPGFIHGSVLAAALILAFLISGHYGYLGGFIQFEEVPFAIASVLIRIIALAALVYSEEFIFRKKILRAFSSQWPMETASVATAVLYCVIKMLQFDLGIMHLITLFLIALALAVRTVRDRGDFSRGAGFLSAVLILFHPLLSLPVLGNDFSGILLIKHQKEGLDALLQEGNPLQLDLFLSGGAGGPLSSFALQLLLMVDIVRGLLENKKSLGKKADSALK